MEFPHMTDPAFPNIENVDVYKYRNEFDYSRYDTAQMRVQLCTVPWDMGEAHVGNRTISGIGNVVWFETETKRDEWFAAISDDKCFRFTTKYRELHRDNEIYVPVPFDVASLYNYLVVEYEPFAGAGDFVEYETGNGLMKWFWFIREVEFISPNTTKLHLLNDAWQTFMYRLNVSGMILERGHAPMFEVSADDYLANPLRNSAGLLAPDVNYGDAPRIVAHNAAHVFNESAYAVIATTANPTRDWGSKSGNDWVTPASAYNNIDGTPGVRMFAVAVGDLSGFLANMESAAPQFAQTVKGVFFAPQELLTLGDSYTFCGTTCYPVSTSRKTLDFITLDKSQFGYPSAYADIAKLYTSPYAHIEITDENGDMNVVNVEDTTGTLRINAALSLAWPAVQVQAHLLGAGSAGTSSLTFANITSRSFTVGGKWYETLKTWNVPIFGIIQSGEKRNDYATHFDRAQQVTAYNNTYDSSVASADTAQTNAGNSAGTITDNAALQVTANTASTAAGAAESALSSLTNAMLNTALTGHANSYTQASTNNSIALTEAQAAASQASNGVGTAVSAGLNAAMGNIPGAVAAVANGVTSAATLAVTTEAGINYTSAQAAASIANNNANATSTNTAQANLNQQSLTSANSRRDAANALTTGAAANNAATMITNAANTNATDRANATRERNTASSAVTNSINQAALDAPSEYGNIANTGNATTKPIAMIANIVTQTQGAIRQAGDEFLRYGYMYDRQWPFTGNWNIGKHFTYWKLRDFWVSGLNIPDMYVDKLRFFLYGGVTVWGKPEDIGHVTIYENM